MVDKWQRSEDEAAEEGLTWFVNREAVEKHFAANGAEVQVYRQYREGGRKHVERLVFVEEAEAGLNSGVFGPFELIDAPDGNLLFRVTTTALSQDGAPSEEQIEHLKALVGDLRIRFEVEVPTTIVSATTPERKGRKAVWVFDAKKDDTFLRKLPAIHLIYAEMLRYCKPTTQLLHFARGEIVDTEALIAALDNGQLATYITDFPSPELLSRDDVIQIPHLGASTEEAEDNCATMAADQLIDFLENGNIKNSVNFPVIHLSRNSGYRITFSNNNVPKVLGNVLSLLADQSINVIDMVNKSRDDIAYNIIDIETEPTDELIEAVCQVEGVIRARKV